MQFQRVLSRSFASAASAAPKIPATLHGIDGRYATALYSAAARSNILDKVESDISRIATVIQNDAKIQSFLETPIVDRAAKKEGVQALLSKGNYSPITTNLFTVMAENGRLDLTAKVINSFNQLMTAHRGEVTATITSAKEMDAKTLAKLQSSLQKSSLLEKNQKLVLNTKIDATILGGLIIEVGDKTIDLSVSSKVAKLERLLKEPV